MSGYLEALEREARALPSHAQPPPRALFEAEQPGDDGLFAEFAEEVEPLRTAVEGADRGTGSGRVEPPVSVSMLSQPVVSDLDGAQAAPASDAEPSAPVLSAITKPEHENAIAAEPSPMVPSSSQSPLEAAPQPTPDEPLEGPPSPPPAITPFTADAPPVTPVDSIDVALLTAPEPAPPPPSPVLATPVPAEPAAPADDVTAPASAQSEPAADLVPQLTIEIGEIHIRLAPEQSPERNSVLRAARSGAVPSLQAFLTGDRRE